MDTFDLGNRVVVATAVARVMSSAAAGRVVPAGRAGE